jgi:predicted nucleotide-binding protein
MEENQNEIGQRRFEYMGTEVSLNEAEEEAAKAVAEAKKNSIWRSIAPGKTAMLTFTGRVFKREAQWENGKALKYDFELTEKNPEGKNRLFSVGSQSKIARAILKNLKEGNMTILLSRDGEGKNTTYKVSVPE